MGEIQSISVTAAKGSFLSIFFWKQLQACLFPAFIFSMLVLSKLVTFDALPRYDFLLLSCIGMQIYMYLAKLESARELLVVTMFHILGFCLEVFKVSMGSWSYPDMAYTKWLGVPLYSGFMYASVGSYVCQAWKRFDVRLSHWPGLHPAMFISAGIYLNFFTHHFIWDFRWVFTLLLVLVFCKTKIHYTIGQRMYSMPMVIVYFLIGLSIWLAENLATFLGAWEYATQHEGWRMVSFGKISSWFLLVVLSVVLVVQLKMWQSHRSMTSGEYNAR